MSRRWVALSSLLGLWAVTIAAVLSATLYLHTVFYAATVTADQYLVAVAWIIVGGVGAAYATVRTIRYRNNGLEPDLKPLFPAHDQMWFHALARRGFWSGATLGCSILMAAAMGVLSFATPASAAPFVAIITAAAAAGSASRWSYWSGYLTGWERRHVAELRDSIAAFEKRPGAGPTG